MDNACARTRLYAYLPLLAGYGISWHLASYTWHKYDRFAGNPRRSLFLKLWLELLPLRTFVYFFRADTLFFQKREIHKFYAWAGKRLGKRIVYDIDDAIYLKTPEALTGDESHRIESNDAVRAEIEWILARCDLALVSGDELARFCLQHTSHVRILPSVISVPDAPASFPPILLGGHKGSRGVGRTSVSSDLDFGFRISDFHPRPVIGWVGAPENQRYLREIEQVLMRLQGEIPDLEVWIVTSRLMNPPPRFRYTFIPWSREAEAAAIPKFTVGIAPLADDAWCRAKMNYKALVYMGYGVPAVVTPVGFPADEFEDGHSVLLAQRKTIGIAN